MKPLAIGSRSSREFGSTNFENCSKTLLNLKGDRAVGNFSLFLSSLQ